MAVIKLPPTTRPGCFATTCARDDPRARKRRCGCEEWSLACRRRTSSVCAFRIRCRRRSSPSSSPREGVEGTLDESSFLLAVAVKRSTRSDRLYQPLFEANVLKYLIVHVLTGQIALRLLDSLHAIDVDLVRSSHARDLLDEPLQEALDTPWSSPASERGLWPGTRIRPVESCSDAKLAQKRVDC